LTDRSHNESDIGILAVGCMFLCLVHVLEYTILPYQSQGNLIVVITTSIYYFLLIGSMSSKYHVVNSAPLFL